MAACLLVAASIGAKQASAVDDTRTLVMHHMHTGEDLTITYKRNGQFDPDAMKKIDWFLRDWRKSQSTTMDPNEIDLLWEVYQEIGAKEPIQIVCGYRSPDTNEMLRHKSLRSGVARFSQHTLGKAIDFYIPGVNLEKLRETAMRLQGGGVGYYPTSGSPFVHLDVGNVRAWPRMTREQLVRLFPDGRTVHLPTDGKPLSGYQLAKADLERGHRNVGEPQPKSFLAALFGRDKDSEEGGDTRDAAAPAPRSVVAKPNAKLNSGDKPAAPLRTLVASAADIFAPPAKPVPMPPRRPTYQLASADDNSPVQTAAPIRLASMSPNDIVSSRGLWDSLVQQAAAKTPETTGMDVSSARRETPRRNASRRDTTASVGPFATGADRVPSDVALAYAAQPEAHLAQATAQGTAVVTTKGQASIANKPDPSTSMVQTHAAEHIDDPWLRGLVLTSDLQNSLVVSQVGDPDFKTFTRFMTKPRSSVMMTFTDAPYRGLTTDQFSGSAVVFPSTVTFAAARR